MEVDGGNQNILSDLTNKGGSMNVSDTTTIIKTAGSKVRTIDIVDDLVDKAKLNKDDLMPLVQNVNLTNTIANDEYRLMELDQEKLNYLLEGNSLIIRGNNTENAICCTNNATFSFKVAEISNPLLITTNLTMPDNIEPSQSRLTKSSEVVFMSNTYFILTKERPKLQKLHNLLELNLYSGKAIDANSNAKKYTISDFLDMIQASEEEIYNYLNFIEAYQIDGYWRLLDPNFYNELLDNLLKLIDEKGWTCDHIPVKEIYSELEDLYSLSILSQLVKYYFTRREDDSEIYEISQQKFVHFYADVILRATMKMRYSEFQLILRRSIPSCFNYEFQIADIQDICYVEEPNIYYLNFLDLPDDIEKRLKFLFEKRPKWNYDELKAFIQDLCSNNVTEINTCLTKYCRPFNVNGVKYFTSRI